MIGRRRAAADVAGVEQEVTDLEQRRDDLAAQAADALTAVGAAAVAITDAQALSARAVLGEASAEDADTALRAAHEQHRDASDRHAATTRAGAIIEERLADARKRVAAAQRAAAERDLADALKARNDVAAELAQLLDAAANVIPRLGDLRDVVDALVSADPSLLDAKDVQRVADEPVDPDAWTAALQALEAGPRQPIAEQDRVRAAAARAQEEQDKDILAWVRREARVGSDPDEILVRAGLAPGVKVVYDEAGRPIGQELGVVRIANRPDLEERARSIIGEERGRRRGGPAGIRTVYDDLPEDSAGEILVSA